MVLEWGRHVFTCLLYVITRFAETMTQESWHLQASLSSPPRTALCVSTSEGESRVDLTCSRSLATPFPSLGNMEVRLSSCRPVNFDYKASQLSKELDLPT